jgi:hydrophobic/amphiphilic exporter-1 (mainly G- bacteria), HAE1 family
MPARGAASNFTTSRPVAVLMVFLAAVVFGYFSYGRLDVALMPELSYPSVTVRTEYPGAAPEEVEREVTQPLEEVLGVIGGLRRLSSVSRAGVSDVVLELSWDTDISEAVQDALERLDLVELPAGARQPLLLRYDPALDPVLELSLTSARAGVDSERELRRLRRLAELQVKRELEPIAGVAAVRVRGGLDEQVHVLLDPGKLSRAGLSIERVIDRLAEENINVAGGTLEEGRTEYLVRTLGEYATLEDIADTVIARSEGRDIRVRDLGRVLRAHEDRTILTRSGGGESVQLEIFKEADENLVALAHRVKRALGELPPEGQRAGPEVRGARGPPGAGGLAAALLGSEDVRLEIAADRSVFVERSIREVRNTALVGGLLAVLVLFLFLQSTRSTLIIAVSIPVSLLATFAPLNLVGVSLNIMSLGGLALGIGMLVDSSIVVLESIYRCREQGDDLTAAAVRGTREVRGAVVASVLTTIGVFLPMVFVEGVAGQAFGDLGLAVVLSLLASLAVALFLIPMLASRRGLRGAQDADGAGAWLTRFGAWQGLRADVQALRWWLRLALGPYLLVRFLIASALELTAKLLLLVVLGPLWLGRRLLYPALAFVLRQLWRVPLAITSAALRLLGELYPRLLRWSLAHAGHVLVVTAACLGLTVHLIRSLDSELLPEVHQGEFTVEIALPVGTPLEETDAILRPVEEELLESAEGIESLLLTVGYDPQSTRRSDEGVHTASLKVVLEPSRHGEATERAVAERIRRRLADIPDLEARLARPVLLSFRTPIEVELYGSDLQRLRQMSERIAHEMQALPELTDIETTLRRGAPEVQILFDRDRLRRHGLNLARVAERVRDEVQGREATRLRAAERRIPVIVRLDGPYRDAVEDIRQLSVDPDGTRQMRLSSVADIALGEGPSEVRRIDGHRAAIVRANLAPGTSLGGAVGAIERRLDAEIEWPADMSYQIAGQSEEWNRSRTSLWLALGLSIFLVYVVMASQFESLLYPFIIIFAVPLAFFGTSLALAGLGMPLSVVVFLGMIMLAGIVVNNAIVLVDTINQRKRGGATLEEAIELAGCARLRPILMTTATTALGLLPMALGLGDGAELRRPLAITVISGLVVSTALTLIVIPTIYAVADRLKARILGSDEERA